MPGVENVKVDKDLDKNLLYVRYDPARVAPEKMVEAIAKFPKDQDDKFKGKIVP